MHVLFAANCKIPVYAYGGTERVIWDLATELVKLGHKVSFLVKEGSTCDFARVLVWDKTKPLLPQLPADIDLVHFQFQPDFDPDTELRLPYVVTEHGNTNKDPRPEYRNTIFLTRRHAAQHNSDQFVHNGLNWEAYGKVDLGAARDHFHFLGMAARPAKNVQGAIDVAKAAGVTLDVMGGTRLNFKRGFRFTLSLRARFHGMVGGTQKFSLLNRSRGLIFPVRWHEPFGLALIESLYFGCPVFGTPYGALPEIVPPEFGHLATSVHELADAVASRRYDARACHAFARDMFNSARMAKAYLEKYETVLSGQKLNAQRPLPVDGLNDLLPWGP